MKKSQLQSIFGIFLLTLTLGSCQEDNEKVSEFTGQEITYQLFASSEYQNEGTITFKEKVNGEIQAEVVLSNTQNGAFHPLHMHYGALGEDGDLAALLNPIDGKTGKSITNFAVLGDESKFTFANLLNFNGSVKIHLDDGAYKDEVLAGGNIGTNRLDEVNIKNCTDFSIGL